MITQQPEWQLTPEGGTPASGEEGMQMAVTDTGTKAREPTDNMTGDTSTDCARTAGDQDIYRISAQNQLDVFSVEEKDMSPGTVVNMPE